MSWATDWSSGLHFLILGTKGTWSSQHIDHHGVITVITCEEGCKVWLVWPQMQWADLENYIATGEVATRPFAICPRPGDSLIMPAGTLHAPMSLETTLMSGHTFWDSRDMARTMELAWLEKIDPSLTNEGEAKEFTEKIERFAGLWRERSDVFPLGTEEQREKVEVFL